MLLCVLCGGMLLSRRCSSGCEWFGSMGSSVEHMSTIVQEYCNKYSFCNEQVEHTLYHTVQQTCVAGYIIELNQCTGSSHSEEREREERREGERSGCCFHACGAAPRRHLTAAVTDMKR
jgi:hypothetical protein